MATPSETTTALLGIVSDMQHSLTDINMYQSRVIESLNIALSSSHYRHDYIHEHLEHVNRYHTNVDRTIRLIEMMFDSLILQSVTPRQPVATHASTPPIPTRASSSSFSSRFSRSDNAIAQLLTQLLIADSGIIEVQPRAGLTDDEINRYTELKEYHSANNMTEPRCPITYDDFVEGEQVRCIQFCRHYFKDRPLLEWLHRYSICPVCRHNLRITV